VTPHGEVATPVFMPVGTAAAVKAVLHRDLAEIGARILLANTYHLMLRPGDALVASLGGLHGFTGWSGPFLTDSGGYQVFSLAALRKLDEEGVASRATSTAASTCSRPSARCEVQQNLGADIAMAFDECPPGDAPATWSRRPPRARRAGPGAAATPTPAPTSGCSASCRAGSTWTCAPRAPGRSSSSTSPATRWAGLAVGEPKPGRDRVLEEVDALLPADRPALPDGSRDARGPDRRRRPAASTCSTACCRPATPGTASSSRATAGISIRNARYRDDPRPPDPDCRCHTCRTGEPRLPAPPAPRGEMTAATLMSLHNLFFYLDMMEGLRQSIRLCRFESWRGETLRRLGAADQDGS
jgi:queuine tRNA-ribosyltransferase